MHTRSASTAASTQKPQSGRSSALHRAKYSAAPASAPSRRYSRSSPSDACTKKPTSPAATHRQNSASHTPSKWENRRRTAHSRS